VPAPGIRRCSACGRNEIPALIARLIARWHGHCRIERFIERLYEATKEVDAHSLLT
jgi:hypothetical protein